MIDLSVKIGKVKFLNPVWVASGTFGCGNDFQDFLDISKVGAIVTKTVTLKERKGNPPPRVVETASGMLNAIGLENNGAKALKDECYSFLKKTGTRTVVSISGPGEKEFAECAKILSEKNFPDAFELNLSCPNISHGGKGRGLIAQDEKAVRRVIKEVKRQVPQPVIAKLTPNVTDIAGIAKAAEKAGADAVSLVNTYYAMAIDVDAMKPLLGNITGGLSGPAIKPMAIKAVYDVSRKVKIPVIGMGGIMTGRDVAEFMLAGASSVQVGTANLADPTSYRQILKEFKAYLKEHKVQKARDLTGGMSAL